MTNKTHEGKKMSLGQRFTELFWIEHGDYSIIKGEVHFWEHNWLTGHSRIIDTFSGTEIYNL